MPLDILLLLRHRLSGKQVKNKYLLAGNPFHANVVFWKGWVSFVVTLVDMQTVVFAWCMLSLWSLCIITFLPYTNRRIPNFSLSMQAQFNCVGITLLLLYAINLPSWGMAAPTPRHFCCYMQLICRLEGWRLRHLVYWNHTQLWPVLCYQDIQEQGFVWLLFVNLWLIKYVRED